MCLGMIQRLYLYSDQNQSFISLHLNSRSTYKSIAIIFKEYPILHFNNKSTFITSSVNFRHYSIIFFYNKSTAKTSSYVELSYYLGR